MAQLTSQLSVTLEENEDLRRPLHRAPSDREGSPTYAHPRVARAAYDGAGFITSLVIMGI